MSWEQEQIGDCTLYLGDAMEVLPGLGEMDVVVTDPPYGVEATGKRAHLGHGKNITTFRPGTYSHPDTSRYIDTVVLPVLEVCRAHAKAVAITPGTRQMWRYPEPQDMGCFFSAAGTGMGRWGFTCCHPILFYGKDPYLTHNLGSRPNSCGQLYPNDANTQEHPFAKPLPMMLWLVQRASLPHQLVCDPFMGSGTTGVACIQLQRRFIGIEIDPRYFDLCCRRIEEASRQGDLFREVPPTHARQEVLL